MSVIQSQNLTLGSSAPDFFLFDVVTGKNWSLDQIMGDEKRPFLIIIMCNHCPYVKHVEDEIGRIGKTYTDRLAIAAISANDVSLYPDDSPDHLKEQAKRLGFNFPYFYDDRQDTAKAYMATCTPDFYLFDNELKLVYHGQLDGSRPSNNTETNGEDLRNAIDKTLIEEELSQDQKPSVGCNVKWKPGNEPDYV